MVKNLWGAKIGFPLKLRSILIVMVKVSARSLFPQYGEAFFRIPALVITSEDSVHPHRLLAFFDSRPDFHDLPGPISLLTCSSDDLGISGHPMFR